MEHLNLQIVETIETLLEVPKEEREKAMPYAIEKIKILTHYETVKYLFDNRNCE